MRHYFRKAARFAGVLKTQLGWPLGQPNQEIELKPRIRFEPMALVSVLRATREQEPSDDRLYDAELFFFADPLLKYCLFILPNLGSVQFSMDPDEPIQACPMLEYSFNCCEIHIGQSAYSSEPENAIRFYEHRNDRGGLRLTLTPLVDGRWYTWVNTWHDLGLSHATALPWRNVRNVAHE